MSDSRQRWLQYARTAEECLATAHTLSGFPDDWIDWAEKIANRVEAHGNTLHNPLGYRLTVIWNGFILLQESKFFCDTVENSFRTIIGEHVQLVEIRSSEVGATIPGWKALKDRLSRYKKFEINDDSKFPTKILMELTFHQVVEVIFRNWKRILTRSEFSPGFNTYFTNDRRYKHAQKFFSDATYVRKFRNKVAHSNRLFQCSETERLFRTSSSLIGAQNGDLNEKVLRYRRSRPRFLESIVEPSK